MRDPLCLHERLTEQLYEGVLTDDGWNHALRTISEITHSPQASVIVFDTQAQRLGVNETFGLSTEAVAAYNAHYHLLDEALPLVPSLTVGHWYLDRRDIGEQAIRQSAFYQEFLLPHDMASSVSNCVLSDSGLNAYLSLQRRPGQPYFTDAELSAFDRFTPHMQRAVRIRMHLQRLAERAGLASVVLDSLRVPLLVLDERGRVMLANAEAETLLQQHPQLKVRQECLQPQGLRTSQFEQLLRSACGQGVAPMAGGALITDATGQPTLQLMVLPLPAHLQSFNIWQRPLALVLLQEPQSSHDAPPHLLQQLYGLTPAEARVALALFRGDTPAQAADRLNVTLGTVRTQIKAAFAKTGVRRQADLVRLLAALRIVG